MRRKLIGLVAILYVSMLSGCSDRTEALVHVSFPADFKLLNSSNPPNQRHASIYLPTGINVLRFDRRDTEYACVLDVVNGGEIYVTLEPKDCSRVLKVEEAR